MFIWLQISPSNCKGNFIYQASWYLFFVVLCKPFVHIMSKDLLCQSDQSLNYHCKETLSNWSTSMRFLIFKTHHHIWQISDSLIQCIINFKTYLFPGSIFWFQEEVCAILLLIRTCSGYWLNWQARQLIIYLTVVFVNKCRLWIIAAVSWDCVCVHSARLNYNKIIAINSSVSQ